MIVFDLNCSGGHVFEAWFKSSSAFEDQRARGLLICPICSDTDIGKAVMAPNLPAKGNARTENAVSSEAPKSDIMATAAPSEGAAAMATMMRKLAEMQADAIKSSKWVGKDFEKQARAMDAGEIDHAQIHGQVSNEQARGMLEDGIGVMPLLIPIVPPEEQN